jgi:hypothetical protein
MQRGQLHKMFNRLRTRAPQAKTIGELRAAESPLLIERGRDNSVLIIAFTGFVHRLSLRVYEFFEVTQATGYSRILLCDKQRIWYHHGIDQEHNDYPSLIVCLKSQIAKLKPQKIICVGTSAGGYAAIVAGHHIGADYVHAFAPDTFLDVSLRSCIRTLWAGRYRLPRWKLLMSRTARWEFFDLAELLKVHNGKTVYYVHHCSDAKRDVQGADRIAEKPGVVSLPYPCKTHSVAFFLAKEGFLKEILNIANQDRLAELAKTYFDRGR